MLNNNDDNDDGNHDSNNKATWSWYTKHLLFSPCFYVLHTHESFA